MKTNAILCYGSLNIDYVYHVEKICNPGESVQSHCLEIFSGGKGANQSVAAARAGGRIYHAGKIGRDGVWILNSLRNDGINIENIMISEVTTGHAVIQVDDEGENAICIHGGANQTLKKSDINQTIKNFNTGSVIMVQNETNELAHILKTAATQGMFICLNPSPITETLLTLDMRDIDLLVVNEFEAAALTQNSADEFTALRKRCPRAIIVKTMGSIGGEAIMPDSDEPIIYHSCNVKAVDTTAAGDTFIGYLVVGLSQGESLKSALNTAARAAEACVKVKGAQSSIPLRSCMI